ncbi:MAG TPA: hypothetical protein VFS91_04190 [Nitrobacter sp.]|nr:hypothetical protein [Nitrobacter sp.]
MDEERLDSILNEQPAEQAEPPAEEAPQQERDLDDKGRFIARDTGVEETPAAEEPPAATPAAEPERTVPLKAHEDERRKRQELERRAQYLEAQLAAIQRPQQTEQPAGFWDDPDARLEQFGEALIQRFEQRQAVNRANASEAAAKAKYQDYDEVIQEFHRAAAENPRLVAEMFNAPDPAEFAYKKARSMRQIEEVGDLDALKAKLRAEWEAEVKASLTSSITAPTTTAGLRSTGARTGPEWSGPTELGDILGR